MSIQSLLMAEVTLGSDVEFFLRHKHSGEIVSAEGLIPGTKHEPAHFDPNNKYYATSLDNVMAEGNIPPTANALDFYKSIEKLRKHIDSLVINQNLETIAIPSARLDFKWLQTENAKLFGCEPSFNAWSGEWQHPQAKDDNARSAGFHIHCGYDSPSEETNNLFGRACDLFLGIPSIIMEPMNERKHVGYGLAGNIRNKPYGVEYRTLSSYFASSQQLTEWSFRNTLRAVNFINNGHSSLIENMGDEIQRIINQEDRKAAKAIVKEFNLELV